jgi:hypothetical protein
MIDSENNTTENNETTVVLNTPKEVLSHVDKRLQEDRLAHIHVKSHDNRGVFDVWMKKARLWYDTNTCGCKKKGLSEDFVLNEYKNFSTLSQEEKDKAYRILGCRVELYYEGNLIVKLPS